MSVSPPPPVPEEAPERETSSVELLWDLVFVFAVTQVTTLLAAQPSWGRFAQSMLVLALIWWAWSAFVWASNALEADSRLLRGHLLAATVLIFIAGLALPHAFGNEAILFTGAYVLVRMVHMKLYVDAARAGRAGLRAVLGFAATTGIGMALLIIGALAGGAGRDALWAVALAIDYAGPAWLTRERLRGLQRVAVAHFADRYSDFIIICLGESIVSVGVGVADSEHQLSVALVASATFGLLIALGMWWTYFDSVAGSARERPGAAGQPRRPGPGGRRLLQLSAPADRRRGDRLRGRNQDGRPQFAGIPDAGGRPAGLLRRGGPVSGRGLGVSPADAGRAQSRTSGRRGGAAGAVRRPEDRARLDGRCGCHRTDRRPVRAGVGDRVPIGARSGRGEPRARSGKPDLAGRGPGR